MTKDQLPCDESGSCYRFCSPSLKEGLISFLSINVVASINQILDSMQHSISIIIGLALILSGVYIYHETVNITEMPMMEQTSANFAADDLIQLRWIVYKAGTLYNSNLTHAGDYVFNEVRLTFGSFWSVTFYSRGDFESKFTLTGFDKNHPNKRYFQATDTVPYGFSILILENNNTKPDNTSLARSAEVASNKEDKIEGLQYTKRISPYVSLAQEKGIDLAITTAYTWNKSISSFTLALENLVQINLSEHWEVLTRYEYLPNFSYTYTSQYQQWVEYEGYGLGSSTWHVYLWRNYLNG